MRNFKWATAKYYRSQLTLLAPSLDDMVPPEHQIRALETLMNDLDWSRWESCYNADRGQPPIHPMPVAGTRVRPSWHRLFCFCVKIH